MTTDKTADNKTNKKDNTSRFTTEIDSTTYDVYIHFNENAKETITDKILRLIKNERVK